MNKGGRPERFDETTSIDMAILSCFGLETYSSLARKHDCSRNTVAKHVNRFKERLEVLGYAD